MIFLCCIVNISCVVPNMLLLICLGFIVNLDSVFLRILLQIIWFFFVEGKSAGMTGKEECMLLSPCMVKILMDQLASHLLIFLHTCQILIWNDLDVLFKIYCLVSAKVPWEWPREPCCESLWAPSMQYALVILQSCTQRIPSKTSANLIIMRLYRDATLDKWPMIHYVRGVRGEIVPHSSLSR